MKKLLKTKWLMILVAMIFILLILGTHANAETEPFTLSEESVDVYLNGSSYLYGSGGDTSESVTWESADTSIATVESGTVKGLKIGTTTITATRGTESVTCTVNVVYRSISIKSNETRDYSSLSTANVNLILGEHETETLTADVEDSSYADVANASVTWKSSNTSVVTISSNGVITAVKAGTATITVTSTGVETSCTVTVYDSAKFTDFSNAVFETQAEYDNENLKISGITPSEDNAYYYIITSTNTKPNLILEKRGYINFDEMDVDYLLVNTDDNYMYTRNLAQYAELNQDLYLWVVETVSLPATYYNDDGNAVNYTTKYVVEGEKLDRTLPALNLIIQSLGMSNYTGDNNQEESTCYMNFNFPSTQETRKFTLKIGRVTDTSILTKIQNGDYSGITELLTYAKSNSAVYSQTLTTTYLNYFRSDSALFDGRSLLIDDAYYFIYVQFDDEDGKYYPIEGVTLGQAWFSSVNDYWDIYAYTSSDFEWSNLTVSDGDGTTATGAIPQTGETCIIVATAILVLVCGTICLIKYKNLKDVK